MLVCDHRNAPEEYEGFVMVTGIFMVMFCLLLFAFVFVSLFACLQYH